MILHQNRLAVPLGAGVLEVADHLALLGIDADDGKTASLETSPQCGDVLELVIAKGTGVGGDLLAVHPQREVHLVEQAGDRVGGNVNADLPENLSDVLGGLAGPLQPADGVSGGVVFEKNFYGIDDFGRFFSTRFRPPPALRARSTSTS